MANPNLPAPTLVTVTHKITAHNEAVDGAVD